MNASLDAVPGGVIWELVGVLFFPTHRLGASTHCFNCVHTRTHVYIPTYHEAWLSHSIGDWNIFQQIPTGLPIILFGV